MTETIWMTTYRQGQRVTGSPVLCVLVCLLLSMYMPLVTAQDNPKEHSAKAEIELQSLMQSLTHDDAETRLAAVKKLGYFKEARAEAAFLQLLRTDESNVQMAAAWAMGKIQAASLLPTFKEKWYAKAPAKVRQSMLLALSDYPADEAIPRWIDALSDEAEGVRASVLQQLRNRTGMSMGYSADAKSLVRRQSIKAWQSWWKTSSQSPDSDWWGHVADDLSASDKRTVTVKIASEHKYTSIPLLIAWLEDDSQAVRRKTVDSLRKLTLRDFGYDPEASKQDRSDALRQWQRWLSTTAFDDPETLWIGALDDDKARMRLAAIQNLKTLEPDHVIPVLIGMLADNSEPVRVATAEALFQLAGRRFQFDPTGDREHQQAMILRWRAWLAESIDKPRAEIIIGALTANDGAVRARALQDLMQANPVLGVEHTIDRMMDPSYRVRQQAVDILKQEFKFDFGGQAEWPTKESALKKAQKIQVEAQRKWQRWWRLNKNSHIFPPR